MARFRHIPNNAKEMKIEINPAYESERELLVRIPEERYAAEQTFCCDRNTVVRVNIGSHEYVVKRFKVPHLINRFAYTFIRKDKALRSYLNAFRLREAHFDTPEPVAYMAIYKQGLYHTGYYVSRYYPSERLDELMRRDMDAQQRDKLYDEFIDFTYRQHQAGVYMKDYNLGNVLVTYGGEHYHFALVDINRMKFNHHPSYREAMTSFDQTGLPIPQFSALIPLYAKLVGEDPEQGIYLMLKERNRRWRKIRVRAVFKRLFPWL